MSTLSSSSLNLMYERSTLSSLSSILYNTSSTAAAAAVAAAASTTNVVNTNSPTNSSASQESLKFTNESAAAVAAAAAAAAATMRYSDDSVRSDSSSPVDGDSETSTAAAAAAALFLVGNKTESKSRNTSVIVSPKAFKNSPLTYPDPAELCKSLPMQHAISYMLEQANFDSYVHRHRHQRLHHRHQPFNPVFSRHTAATTGSIFGHYYRGNEINDNDSGAHFDDNNTPLSLVKAKTGLYREEDLFEPEALDLRCQTKKEKSKAKETRLSKQINCVNLNSKSLNLDQCSSSNSSGSVYSGEGRRRPLASKTCNDKRRFPSDPEAHRSVPSKRMKSLRKFKFDEHKSSPVSGTFILDSDNEEEFAVLMSQGCAVKKSGDIDPSLNIVVVTPEARAEIAKIENRIGDYVCALCKEFYEDAFALAQHSCSRIVHIEYRCPECDKVFNCPANLASHRRWHKPKIGGVSKHSTDQAKKKSTLLPINRKSKSLLEKLSFENLHQAMSNLVETSEERRNKVTVKGTAIIECLEETDTIEPGTEKEDKYECELCGKRFRKSSYLRKHRLTQHDIRRTNNVEDEGADNNSKNESSPEESSQSIDWKCQLCEEDGKHFECSRSLEEHYRECHQEQVLTCPACEALLDTEENLSSHIKAKHWNKKLIAKCSSQN